MKRVLFDFDNTMGTGFDTDDGLALMYLLGHAKDVEILGLTCTYGNSDIDTVYENTRRIVAELGLDIPVLKGAANPDAPQSEAAEFLARQVAAHPGEVSLLATGSLTNLKQAAAVDPGFFGNVRELALMGGITRSLVINGRIMNELNFSCDAAAACAALGASCPVTVATAHSCLPATFTKKLFCEHVGEDSWLMRQCSSWFDWMTHGYDMEAFICWDVVAAATLVQPGLFEFETMQVTLNERLLHVGYLEQAAADAPQSQIRVPAIKDADAFRAACFAAWKQAMDGVAV